MPIFLSSVYLARLRSLLALAIPLASRQLAQVGIGIVDTVMMGFLGSQVLAAAGLGSTFVLTIVYIYRGGMRAVNVLAAEAFGAKKTEEASAIATQGFWLTGMISLPIALFLWFLPSLLLKVGLEETTVALTQSYLHAIVWGLPAAFGLAVLEQVASGLSAPQSITQIMLVGAVLNGFANYALIFGHWGFPSLGIAGAGYASALVMGFNFTMAIAVVKLAPQFRPYHLLGQLHRFDRSLFGDMVRIGCPVALQHAADMGLVTVTAVFMGYLGTAQLAANEIAFQTVEALMIVAIGLSEALTVKIGQMVGGKNFADLRSAIATGAAMGVIFISLITWELWNFPEVAIAIYLNADKSTNAETIEISRSLLPIAALFYFFFGLHLLIHGVLLGFRDTRIPMFANIFSYWCVGGISGYALGFLWHGGATGIWWGLTSGLAIATVLLTIRFYWLFPPHSRQ
jgi:MATE family multidrug resistance protein